jgi:hypothetical protein
MSPAACSQVPDDGRVDFGDVEHTPAKDCPARASEERRTIYLATFFSHDHEQASDPVGGALPPARQGRAG